MNILANQISTHRRASGAARVQPVGRVAAFFVLRVPDDPQITRGLGAVAPATLPLAADRGLGRRLVGDSAEATRREECSHQQQQKSGRGAEEHVESEYGEECWSAVGCWRRTAGGLIEWFPISNRICKPSSAVALSIFVEAAGRE